VTAGRRRCSFTEDPWDSASSIWFARFNRSAALLLLPYLAWVAFAAMLNWTLWQRNPALLA
jgi:benzodiazapine receptor